MSQEFVEFIRQHSNDIYYFTMGLGGLTLLSMGYAFLRVIQENKKRVNDALEAYKCSYLEESDSKTLVDLYKDLCGVKGFASRKNSKIIESALVNLETRLRPIIISEIKHSLETTEVTPKTNLEELSKIYAECQPPYQQNSAH